MFANNDSTLEVLLVHQQKFHVALSVKPITKLTFAMLLSLFFIYLNSLMAYTLWSKPVFKETPRYILFNHMLINDSIQMFISSLLYVFLLANLKLLMAACAFVISVSVTTSNNAPLNLALMSLERYVAISFPLRHAEIATQRRMYFAIGIIWFIGVMYFTIEMIYVVLIDVKFVTSQIYCTRERLFIKQWQVNASQGFNIFLFVSVPVIILFTYVKILITSRTISSSKDSAAKAHKTVLLHLIQLGLCLTSFLFGIIEQAAAKASSSSSLFMDLRYLNYVFVVMLPRCLSPLIYGLRDDAVRPLFLNHFRCATGKRKSTVSVRRTRN